jgi:hypothetical protein
MYYIYIYMNEVATIHRSEEVLQTLSLYMQIVLA